MRTPPMLGKHHTEESKNKIRKAKNRPVLQYTKDGEFVREWESLISVQRTLGFNTGSLWKNLTHKIKQSYGYVWRYKNRNLIDLRDYYYDTEQKENISN